MDPVTSLKRPASKCYVALCLICQDTKSDHMINGGSTGIASLKVAAQDRLKKKDTENRQAIDRILSFEGTKAIWHKGCFSKFSSKLLRARLTKSKKKAHNRKGSTTRSQVPPLIMDLCMFCQGNEEEPLHLVQTKNTSEKILQSSQYDRCLSIGLAGTSDLIADEGKYHLKCYSKFLRETEAVKDKVDKSNLAMGWLCTELQLSASKGHVLTLDAVWKCYIDFCQEAEEEVPSSYISRRSSFKAKVQSLTEDVYEFIVLNRTEEQEKETVLVPREFLHIPISALLSQDNEEEEETLIPEYKPGDDIFLSLIHVALKLRSDILSHTPYKGMKVCRESAIDCIPESLYMFLGVMYGGQAVFDGYEEDGDGDENIGSCADRIISVAQDLIYGTSHGKMWTPKHVGLGSTLHQATRSKQLVDLFHKAGHTITYKEVLGTDTGLAESTLKSLNPDIGAIVPETLAPDRFVHFSTDNIDILDASLDGKNTFHATQVTAWQRGPPKKSDSLDTLKPSMKTLQVPEVMITNIPPELFVKSPEPLFEQKVCMEWFTEPEEPDPHRLSAEAKDMVFNIRRSTEDPKRSWSHFNQESSTCDPQITTTGFMPIILSPAHEFDTLNTVVQRCKHIANTLGQEYVVITADEQLYSKLMELKWSQKDHSFLIPRLGGLHISMNFMKAIGQHFEASGLLELWVESDLLGSKTAERVLAGKDYEKGMRVHKITLQSLWNLLMPQFMEYLEVNDKDLKQKIEEAKHEDDDIFLLTVFTTTQFHDAFKKFVEFRGSNPNFVLWFTYIEMVSILLLFTRAQRDGLWHLHLSAFKMMLPFFFRYGHTNYGKWGAVYIAQMHMLPPEVLNEFQAGNFVVKIGQGRFNQVDPDQSQEWLNATGKKGGGIVGITKSLPALSRWALSFNLRSQISKDTKDMFGIVPTDSSKHKETSMSRRQQDTEAEATLEQKLSTLGVFSRDLHVNLQNIVTKDQATEEITESLTNARRLGQERLEQFVQERLLSAEADGEHRPFKDPIKRNYPPTFAKLYEVKKSQTQKASLNKADRSVLQRLVISYAAGREVDLDDILRHELLPVPLSLADTDGILRTGPKSILMDELIKEVDMSASYTVPENSTLIVDGQAIVVALGRPQSDHSNTFGDFAKSFVNTIFQNGQQFERIDIVFDRYDPLSIKGATRSRRKKGITVRRFIENSAVPVPTDWQGFLSEPDNKADLTNFLSKELIKSAPRNKIVVTAGGLPQCDAVLCNKTTVDLEELKSNHEEADTRMMLHCGHTDSATVVVWSRDTDVLLLLMAHCHVMNKLIWMKAGTSKAPKDIPINAVIDSWQLEPRDLLSLLSFHALTGSDTTSFLAGHSKRTALTIFMQNKELLSGLGSNPLDEKTVQQCEKFMCKVYNAHTVSTTDAARVLLFKKGVKQELLPPTSDALKLHIMRANLQSNIWQKSMEAKPVIPPPSLCGWETVGDQLKPILLTLPTVPESCVHLVSCSCTGTCVTRRCGCRRSNMPCTGSCKCLGHCLNSN